MTHKQSNRLIGGFVLLASFILYALTVAPTVSFWDCGEFVATSYTLGVPHPPGSPIFLVLGRFFTSIPVFDDISLRMNYMSVISSALTVLLAYLIIVRLIQYYKPNPDGWSLIDKISAYGSAVVGAFAFAVSDSFWYNAVESEVYALSMFFTAIVIWLILEWADHGDEGHNERYLLLIAYVIGLAIGIHLLNMLTIFAVAVIYYFRKYEFTFLGFFIMMLVSVGVFAAIYPGIIKGVPKLLELPLIISFLILGALAFLIYWSHVNRYKLVNLALLATLMIVVGYASYMVILIRANAHPPINENDPSTAERMYSYLNREQYGENKMFPRRWSPDPVHQRYYSRYSSDMDYFITYQVNHMFNRYLGWNFIGRESDIQDAGVDFSKYWAIPFIFGLFGLYYHFLKDYKRGMAVLALFFLTGYAILLYLNQTEPQPRERDYSYVGAFFAFALWIGIGVNGFLETLREIAKGDAMQKLAVPVGLLLTFIFIPGRMLAENYHSHDRSKWYVPADYAKNLLGGLEPNAIIFTNGDNDTFPLWYQQEVERFRTDVRVVNLSLLNTDWYILQLKNEEPRGAAKVALPPMYTDEAIRNIQPQVWEDGGKLMNILVSQKNVMESDLGREPDIKTDSVVSFKMDPTMRYPMDGQVIPLIRVQDFLIYDIIVANQWRRPVYFAITVPEDNRIGIENYLRLEGMVYRVVPSRGGNPFDRIQPEKMRKNLTEIYQFRNLDLDGVYYDENIRRLVQNYRNLFQRLSFYYLEKNDKRAALEVVDKMNAVFSEKTFPYDEARSLINVAEVYRDFPEYKEKYTDYMLRAEEMVNAQMTGAGQEDPMNYLLLERIYNDMKRYKEASELLKVLQRRYPGEPSLITKIKRYDSLSAMGNDVAPTAVQEKK